MEDGAEPKEAKVAYFKAGEAMDPSIETAAAEAWTLQEKWLCTYVQNNQGGTHKLMHYDVEKLVKFGAFPSLLVSGTIFTMDSTMPSMLFTQFLVALIAAIVASRDSGLTELDIKGLKDLSKYLGSFVPFVLGLYISLVMTRWWSLRVEALGPVYNAMSNVCMLLSGTLPCTSKYNDLKEQVLKYGICSVKLMVRAAQDKDEIDDLLENTYLDKAELAMISELGLYQRSMVMWPWIMRISYHAFDENKLPWGVYNNIVKECISARNGIQTIHTYLRTQVPFAYVHLINLIVNLNNIIVSVHCGMTVAICLRKLTGEGGGSADFWQLVTAAVTWFAVPVVYHGLLSISYVIHDPFGEDMLDFPIAAFTEYVFESCKAFYIAQECPAEAVLFPNSERVKKATEEAKRMGDGKAKMRQSIAALGKEIPNAGADLRALKVGQAFGGPTNGSSSGTASGLSAAALAEDVVTCPLASAAHSSANKLLPALTDLTDLLRALETKLPDTGQATQSRLRVERAEMQKTMTLVQEGAEKHKAKQMLLSRLSPVESCSCAPMVISPSTIQQAEEGYLEACSF